MPTDPTIITLTPLVCAELNAYADTLIRERHLAVVLDLASVGYLSSLQIASIITLRQSIHNAGGKVALANLDPKLNAVFRVLKMDRLFALNLNLEQAVAWVGSPAQH